MAYVPQQVDFALLSQQVVCFCTLQQVATSTLLVLVLSERASVVSLFDIGTPRIGDSDTTTDAARSGRTHDALVSEARAANTVAVDKQTVQQAMERDRASFRQFLDSTDADLRRPTEGTRWNNRQLLLHMLLGYLVVRVLLVLVRVFGRLPVPTSRGFARLLNAATVPFDAVNYAGARVAGTVL